jgi:hypothetical protein
VATPARGAAPCWEDYPGESNRATVDCEHRGRRRAASVGTALRGGHGHAAPCRRARSPVGRGRAQPPEADLPQQVMDGVVHLARDMVPGADEATITMVRKDRHCCGHQRAGQRHRRLAGRDWSGPAPGRHLAAVDRPGERPTSPSTSACCSPATPPSLQRTPTTSRSARTPTASSPRLPRTSPAQACGRPDWVPVKIARRRPRHSPCLLLSTSAFVLGGQLSMTRPGSGGRVRDCAHRGHPARRRPSWRRPGQQGAFRRPARGDDRRGHHTAPAHHIRRPRRGLTGAGRLDLRR